MPWGAEEEYLSWTGPPCYGDDDRGDERHSGRNSENSSATHPLSPRKHKVC
jgi:hypothetical protein